jgi:hypothetical protein
MAITAMAAAVAVLLASLGSAGATSTHRRPLAKCAPRHAHALVKGAQAEVYEKETIDVDVKPGEDPIIEDDVYGCAYGHKRAYVLGHPSGGTPQGGGGVEQETLAGTIVAYEVFSVHNPEEHVASYFWIVVRDLRDGRVLHKVPTGAITGPNPEGSVGIGPISALVVKWDGSVAWTTGGEGVQGEYQVHVLDKVGERLVAAGTDVEPRSLVLHGSTLSWVQGGKRLTAPLD